MGVYIHGMEMPEDGETVTLTICADGLVFEEFKELGDVFHAVPVPPHGDLVDRTELREIAISLLDEAVTDQEAYAIRKMWSRFGKMPVFIPAEEDDT